MQLLGKHSFENFFRFLFMDRCDGTQNPTTMYNVCAGFEGCLVQQQNAAHESNVMASRSFGMGLVPVRRNTFEPPGIIANFKAIGITTRKSKLTHQASVFFEKCQTSQTPPPTGLDSVFWNQPECWRRGSAIENAALANLTSSFPPAIRPTTRNLSSQVLSRRSAH